jgi:type II secretory ATPase GspE/PulE/Tfp pilus assembly ATPase PilB-like protein
MDQLEAHVINLDKGVEVATISDEALDQIRQLLGIQEEALGRIAQARILKALEFKEMRGRYEGLEDAHQNTLEWIFRDDDDKDVSASEERTMRLNAREKFKHWLSLGEGIFHISGKLGSGKSTLMKYLTDNGETRNELLKWAGEPELDNAGLTC